MPEIHKKNCTFNLSRHVFKQNFDLFHRTDGMLLTLEWSVLTCVGLSFALLFWALACLFPGMYSCYSDASLLILTRLFSEIHPWSCWSSWFIGLASEYVITQVSTTTPFLFWPLPHWPFDSVVVGHFLIIQIARKRITSHTTTNKGCQFLSPQLHLQWRSEDWILSTLFHFLPPSLPIARSF